MCFKSTANLALAGATFPAAEVEAAGKSFAAIVKELHASSDLRVALAGATG